MIFRSYWPLLLLLLSLRPMESILDVPRSSFQQSASESVNNAVWMALRLVAFLDGATAVAAIVHLTSIIVDDPSPSMPDLVRNSVLLCCCCFHASRLRFWQYNTSNAWWRWTMVDWVALTAEMFAAHVCSRPGVWFLALVNAAAWCVHQQYFRHAVILHDEELRYHASSCVESKVVPEDSDTRQKRYNRRLLQEAEELRARGHAGLVVPDEGGFDPLPEDQHLLQQREQV